MKYTYQLPGYSLDELGIPKNPYFDPSHASVASFWLIPGGGILRHPLPWCPYLYPCSQRVNGYVILWYSRAPYNLALAARHGLDRDHGPKSRLETCREVWRVLIYVTLAIAETVTWIKLYKSKIHFKWNHSH